MLRALVAAALIAALGGISLGCATRQSISLECVPKNVKVYVDARRVEGTLKSLKLTVDEPHSVFLKGGGYQPQMVVFESRERDGKRVLDPVDLCSQLVFVEMQPEVKLELDPDAAPVP